MFKSFLHSVAHWLSIHPGWGYFIAFLVAFAESLPIIGTIVPGSITMTAIGTLIGAEIIPGTSTIICAIIGAFCGDFLGFYVGTKFHESIRNVWPFKKHKKWLDAGNVFFKKHGGKSIVIGRFIGPVRSTIPLIAGILRMQPLRFFAAAIPSAILWALVYFLPGILLGLLSMDLPPHETTRFMIYGFLLIVFLWFIVWAIQKSFRWLCQCINRTTDRTWQVLRTHRTAFFIRWITNQTEPSDHHQLTLILFAGLFSLLFIVLAISVFSQNALTHFNQPLFFLLQSFHTKDLTAFFAAFTTLGAPLNMMAIATLFSGTLFFFKQRRSACHLFGLMLSLSIAVEAVKKLWYNPRPTGILFVKVSSSFPSGHAALSIGILGFLAFLAGRQITRPKRWMVYIPAIMLMVFISLSRLYLGAHWLTDIIGSALISLTFLFITIVAYKRKPAEQLPAKRWFTLLLLIVAICFAGYAKETYTRTIQHAHPIFKIEHVAPQAWWQHPTQYTPAYRLNRFGHPALPFNVQWKAPLNVIKARLKVNDWQPAPKRDFKYNLMRFAVTNPIYHLSFLHRLYHRQKPVLVYIKQLSPQKTIIELILWKSFVRFTPHNHPLWIGTINYQLPKKHFLESNKDALFISLNSMQAIKKLTPALSQQTYKIVQGEDKLAILVIKTQH